MPVTVFPTSNRPTRWATSSAKTTEALFKRSCYGDSQKCTKILQSSFTDLETQHISPSSNGFVFAACEAYSSHHHLKIRPEDVWFSILTQLNFYINKHAEALRSVFVSHEGKKDIVVSGGGIMEDADFGKLALEITEQLDQHLNDPELRNWIMPDFTTTETTDKVVAAITMMGTLQAYFNYSASFACGLPSVTLLGEKEDWVKLRARLDKIPSWDNENLRHFGGGSELKRFSGQLGAVLDFFVRSFEDPQGDEVIDFWNTMAREKSLGSGGSYLSGWLTAFCFWSQKGKPLCYMRGPDPDEYTMSEIEFGTIDTNDIPQGYTSVPVQLNDNGVMYKAKMLAGSVGHRITKSGDVLEQHPSYDREGEPESPTGLDSVQPVVGWWMYECKE